jgi:uncharacterized OB-fold protein
MPESTAPPTVEAPLAAWREHLRADRFMLQQCETCGRSVFYPRVLCPFCGSEALAWRQAGRGGTVYSTTVVARREKDGGPYNVALVDLDEGVRMLSRIEGLAPEDVRIGMRVRPTIGAIDGEPVVLFAPE